MQLAQQEPRPWLVHHHTGHHKMATKGFVSVLPSSKDEIQTRQTHSQGGRLEWRRIERFDMQVMKQLVDKAYGITGEAHPQPQGYKELVHNYVYLPALHRTIDLLDRVKETSSAEEVGRSPTRTQPPLGSNLLSTQLDVLQAELLNHYEHERREAVVAAAALQQARMWSPQRPSSTIVIASPPPGSRAPSRTLPKTGSFRSKRHVEPKSATRIMGSDESSGSDVESGDAMVLTDSDTYSLTSGEGGELEGETHLVESDVDSGSTSWSSSSLASHVLSALEAAEATVVESAHGQAVVTYDSEDLALFADTCSETSAGHDKDSGRSSRASLVSDETSSVGGDRDHVVFVDNGFRVSSSGRLMQSGSLLISTRGDIAESSSGEESQVLFIDNGMRVSTAGIVRAPIEGGEGELAPGEAGEVGREGDVVLVDNGVRVDTSGQVKEELRSNDPVEDTSVCAVEHTTSSSDREEGPCLPERTPAQSEETNAPNAMTETALQSDPEAGASYSTMLLTMDKTSFRSTSSAAAQYDADFDELEAELQDYEPFEE